MGVGVGMAAVVEAEVEAVVVTAAAGGGAGGPGVGGSGGSPLPIIVKSRFGGGDDALNRAAAMTGIARSRALPAVVFSPGGCSTLSGKCAINPATGNLLLSVSPPAGDSCYVPPILYYSSSNASTSNEIGNGWMHTFNRHVRVDGGLTPAVITGTGASYTYELNFPSGYKPTNGAINALTGNQTTKIFSEIAPDGTVYHYGPPPLGSQIAYMVSIQNPAGALWSMTYDSSNRVTSIADPFLRLNTFTYNATSGKINGIQDSFGRITTFLVNSSSNLVQVTTPELCITSLVYDASNRLVGWVNPIGGRTSYTYDSSSRVTSVTTPLGRVTSLSYGTNQTVVTNPLGHVTTLNFTSLGSLASAIDGAGVLTSYSWDANNSLTAIVDGLGNATTFGYVTQSNTFVETLASITQPLGGIFTYTYNSNGQVSSVTDQLGSNHEPGLERLGAADRGCRRPGEHHILFL